MAENFSGKDVAIDIVVGVQSNVLATPFDIAQAEIIAAFQVTER
jgi:hypothetical protein